MKQLEEYAEQAHDCREAANAKSEHEREYLLQMAEHWEELARQRAAHLNLEDVLAELLRIGTAITTAALPQLRNRVREPRKIALKNQNGRFAPAALAH